MTTTEAEKPKTKPIIAGIGAILTDDSGNVVAHSFDFARDGYGGFKLWEAQRYRAKRAAIWKYIRAYTYGPVASAISDYTAEDIVSTLLREKKLRLTCVAIGYDDKLTDNDLNH
jgi:hypothetical protein